MPEAASWDGLAWGLFIGNSDGFGASRPAGLLSPSTQGKRSQVNGNP